MEKYRQIHYDILNLGEPEICKEYERFVAGHENGSFMQSLKWRSVKCTWKCEAVAVRDAGGAICASMLILIKTLPLIGTSLFYSPRGPVCDLHDEALLTCLFDGVFFLSQQYRACALKIDPFVMEDDEAFLNFMQKRGFEFTPHLPDGSTAQTRENYVLNIKGKTPEELFSRFKPKWRYNIRLALKKGVECMPYPKEQLGDFYGLMIETGKRDGFAVRSKRYFERMLESLGESCRLYLCYKDGVPLSGAICVRYGARACYVYGCSSNEGRNLMPNYLMQWRMIEWACESECSLYDFMGIPHYNDPSHSNYGVYRFKQGFGGRVLVYAGEFTYVYSQKEMRLWNMCQSAFSAVQHARYMLKSYLPHRRTVLPQDIPRPSV